MPQTTHKKYGKLKNLQRYSCSFLDNGLLRDGGHLDEPLPVLAEVKDLNRPLLRSGVKNFSGVVDFELNNRVLFRQSCVHEGLEGGCKILSYKIIMWQIGTHYCATFVPSHSEI